jgi:ribonuclease BN (tRNA processing enzyme)
MHGDHVFGLAAVLCQMGSSQRADSRTEPMDVIDIYGPQGE